MKKRLLSVLLLLCMLLTLLPTAAFAEEAHEHVYEEAFACICTVECTEENRNADCPVCGAEAFPWVRGYGNFLQGRKYDEQYQKISKYIMNNKEKKILFMELGVGRMTPMFIQEPFWNLTLNLPDAYYIAVNAQYDFLPKDIEEKGMVIKGDIAKVLKDAAEGM